MSNYVPGGKKRCRSVFPVQREREREKKMWCLASKKRTGWPFQSVWKEKPDVFLKSHSDWRLALCTHIKGQLTRKQQLLFWSQAVLLSGAQMFYKDPDHHAVLCPQTMEVGGGAGRWGLFPLLFFLPLLKPFPSNLSPAAHIQLLAIIPVDPPRSPNGVWISEGFSFCTWQAHVAGRLQGRRWGLSSLGTATRNGVAVIHFPSSKVKARQMWAGRQTGESPQPHWGLLLYCPGGGSGECGWCWWGGQGGGPRGWKRGGSEGGDVRAHLNSSSVHWGLLQQSSPSSAWGEAWQPPYKLSSPWRQTTYPALLLASPLPSLLYGFQAGSQWMSTKWNQLCP